MDLPVNTLLQGGKYRIVRFIGSGGFGCTYEAEHVMLEKRVAIKEFFVKDFCNRDEMTACVTVGTESKRKLVDKLKRKFVDEAKSLSQLRHPGIVSVSDVFEENGTAYFVMDYIEGSSLSELIAREKRLPEKRALRYIRQAGTALRYVHGHNRLHLDVKPGNIMINTADEAVLIDFGASKQYDEAGGENTSTLMGRTPGYAPLEQMGNDVVKFMPATDIYALGATLYKSLTGQTPLSATLLASGEALDPLPKSISESTRKAVEAAMRLNKKERPQTVEEFLEMLDEKGEDDTELSERPKVVVKPKREEEPERISVANRKRKWPLFAFLCAAIVIAVGIFVWPKGEEGNVINGHRYVDLGLSVKWATVNIGSPLQEGAGDYYAWGVTTTGDKLGGEYSEKSYSVDVGIAGDIGGSQYDVARTVWGGSWRLPTKDEFEELKNKCKWEWIVKEYFSGYKITGPSGNSIYLPAGGYRNGYSKHEVGRQGEYWTSTPFDDKNAYSLTFDGEMSYVSCFPKYVGRNIRPVTE